MKYHVWVKFEGSTGFKPTWSGSLESSAQQLSIGDLNNLPRRLESCQIRSYKSGCKDAVELPEYDYFSITDARFVPGKTSEDMSTKIVMSAFVRHSAHT